VSCKRNVVWTTKGQRLQRGKLKKKSLSFPIRHPSLLRPHKETIERNKKAISGRCLGNEGFFNRGRHGKKWLPGTTGRWERGTAMGPKERGKTDSVERRRGLHSISAKTRMLNASEGKIHSHEGKVGRFASGEKAAIWHISEEGEIGSVKKMNM